MIDINMLYWDDNDDIRKENVIISWNELKKLNNFLNNNGIKSNCYLYEFGNTFIFEDSIKINDNNEYYEKSKKINKILFNENSNNKLISIMDSDTFFDPNDYGELLENIKEIYKDNIFYTYNLWDFNEKNRKEIIDNNQINYFKFNKLKSLRISRHNVGYGTLGGFFICHLEKLKEIGGFNEKFKTWGVEDDEAYTKLKTVSNWQPKHFFGPYHLYHPKQLNNEKYFIPVFSDEYFKINDVNKDRNWI